MGTIRERKRHKKTVYYAEVCIAGAPRTGSTFDRKDDARDWIRNTEYAIKQGRSIGLKESKKYTFKDMTERYFQYSLPKRKHDEQKKHRIHLAWWQKHLERYRLIDINHIVINELKDILESEVIQKGPNSPPQHRSPATVRLYLRTLSAVFKVAVNEWGWLDSNPMAKVSSPKVDNARTRYLKGDEQPRILKAARQDSNPHIHDFIILAICTGARWAELSNLTWESVYLDQERPHIYLSQTKNKQNRKVPLTGPALAILKHRKASQSMSSLFVFPNAQGNEPMNLRKAWERVRDSSGIVDFTFHDFRHTTATNLANMGFGSMDIGAILGHKSPQMTWRYSHHTDQYTHRILDEMTAKHFAGYGLESND